MKITPLHDRFGVVVSGVDLSTIDAAMYSDLRALFEAHSALLFRGQEIDDAAHVRLARFFGPLEDRNAESLTGGADFKVPEVSNIQDDGTTSDAMDLQTLNLRANMLWHTDSTFLPTPALTNILIGRVVTDTGGATELASTRAGWADMPPALKDRIRDRAVWHRLSHSRARISPELAALPMFHKWPDQLWRAIWRNPKTGADALYIASHVYAVDGMDEATGTKLIDDLIAWVTQEPYTYSHQWRVGDVLIWDQRAVLHRGTAWNYKEPRVLSSICVSATATDGVDAMRVIV